MKPLTRLERRALGLADHKGGCPISSPVLQPDGTRKVPKGHANTTTANRLVAAGFALKVKRTLLITKAGRAEMNRPIPEDPAVYLKVGNGLTTRLDLSVRDEDEIIDPATLKSFWAAEAAARREGAQAARTRSKGISRSLREAA